LVKQYPFLEHSVSLDDLFHLCEKEKVTIVRNPKYDLELESFSAEIRSGMRLIYLNPSLSLQQQKIFLAHELGHNFLHFGDYHSKTIFKSWREGNLETDDFLENQYVFNSEANFFAILLMIDEYRKRPNLALSDFDHFQIMIDDNLHDFLESYDAETILTLPESIHNSLVSQNIMSAFHEAIQKDPNSIHNIDPFLFESIMAEVFRGLGYDVELTQRSRDGGVDIFALKSLHGIDLKFIIEIKRYAKKRKIDISLVHRLLGVKDHHKATKAILATTSSFTKPALKFQRDHRWELELKNKEELMEWINEYFRKKLR
jgi:HJR/Mrr/RecB family endonuclease